MLVRLVGAEPFDRPTDGTLLRFRCPPVVAPTAVQAAVQETLYEMDVTASQVTVTGPPESNSVLRFSGPPGVSAKRAGKLLGLQRRPDGSWRNSSLVAKHGDSSRLHADTDKSGQQLRREILRRSVRAGGLVGSPAA